MVFVIDGSTSVGFDDFKISVKFITSVIDAFPVTPWGVHIGAVVVQPAYQIVIDLGQYKEKAYVDAAIRQILYPNGDNSVGAALTQAKNVLDRSKRPVPQVVVLLLDNKAADDVSNPAKGLRDSGIGVVAIAGSGDVDQAQLNIMTGIPENVVTTTSYSKLPSILGTVIEKINNSKLFELFVLMHFFILNAVLSSFALSKAILSRDNRCKNNNNNHKNNNRCIAHAQYNIFVF